MSQTTPPTRRLSPLLFAVIMIALLVALVCIWQGLVLFLDQGYSDIVSLYLSVGLVTLAMSTYMMYQTRKRMVRIIGMEMQPLSSTVQCMKCGFKNIREFKRGDFVFKETEEMCPKDSLRMVISAIYREVKDKDKAKENAY
jgi:amino acid permease